MAWPWQRRLTFTRSKEELSLGVELEFQVLDENTLLLTPQAARILESLRDEKFKKEFFQSTLELNSGVCRDVHQVRADLQQSLLKASAVSRNLGLRLGSTGTHPLAAYRDNLMSPDERYESIAERNQWMVRRRAVYGMHIHLGMKSGQRCIQYNHFFMTMMPHLLALSASSPFWQGENTGLATCRLTTYESQPTAASPYFVKGWRQFQRLFRQMIRSKAAHSTHDLWWDLRPSPHHGTLELRFCDEPATLKETLAITAFTHLLAHWYRDNRGEWNYRNRPVKHWIVRENKWRAMRYGLDADIIVKVKGKTRPLKREIAKWISQLRPYVKSLGYETYITDLEEILARGNSAARQVRVYGRSGNVIDVVRHNINEFEALEPIWPEANPHAVN